MLLARMIAGPPDTPGEESFDVTVCSPEWLAKTCREVGGIYSARHHLVVNVEDFDVRALRAWLAARVQEVQSRVLVGDRRAPWQAGLLGGRGLPPLTTGSERRCAPSAA